MKLFSLLIGFILFLTACGENFLKLASEYGEYSAQQVRDIEEMRRQADSCDYEERCFKNSLDEFIRSFCSREEYNKRGFISANECERQYPYVFIQLFKQGKFASVDGLQAKEDYQDAVASYGKERARLDSAEEDYQEAKNEWKRAQSIRDEEDYREAEEDWKEAQEDYDEAYDDYEEARKDYEKAVRDYKAFFRI